MSDLQTRLAEVMQAMKWEHADLVRVSKQSSSVVSQWLGKGSKTKIIKSIGKLEAAIYIERESGYSALWVAKNLGPKKPAKEPAAALALATQPPNVLLSADRVLEEMGAMLKALPPEYRQAVANNLSGWALDGGTNHWRLALAPLLLAPQSKRPKTA